MTTSHESLSEQASQISAAEVLEPTEQVLHGIVDDLERFRMASLDAGFGVKRLADSQLLQGEGIPVDAADLASGVEAYFGPQALAVMSGQSEFMEPLLLPESGMSTQRDRYHLGHGLGVVVDMMKDKESGVPKWVRVSGVRDYTPHD